MSATEEVFLSAGAVQSPHLLVRSGVVDASTVPLVTSRNASAATSAVAEKGSDIIREGH